MIKFDQSQSVVFCQHMSKSLNRFRTYFYVERHYIPKSCCWLTNFKRTLTPSSVNISSLIEYIFLQNISDVDRTKRHYIPRIVHSKKELGHHNSKREHKHASLDEMWQNNWQVAGRLCALWSLENIASIYI
ncbi:hypothetical protein V8G54_032580 [Vigna mungo]|uniref:Uncharacterized protein n=1 Tax=Vigna mungo TaxID=3915 RepID=A0AAQ3RI19_VIGMU